ncbi:MAG: hypothetical protein KA264_01080 [Crocinitomicaceae bacterium]|nr:hypothetical protein [Crocinitomicaceae bacterium]
MKSVLYTFILLALSIASCNTTKLATSNTSPAGFTSSNDTIFYNLQPVAKVEHYGMEVDKRNHYFKKIVVKDISCCDDYSLNVISYVKQQHHNSVVEYRNK